MAGSSPFTSVRRGNVTAGAVPSIGHRLVNGCFIIASACVAAWAGDI